jgi:hypothetical protein
MEFAELMELLRRVRTNPALYQQYYGKILLTSSIRQVGLKLSFNISKRQQYVKGQGEKYEYDMAARFGGPNEHDASLLSCKISSSILEPYFGKPPVSAIATYTCRNFTLANAASQTLLSFKTM